MSSEPYNDVVRDLFAAPAHAGDLRGGITVYVADQGMRIALSARVSQGNIGALRFRAWGCPHFIAAAEAFCTDFEGRPAADLAGFSNLEVMQTLSVPVEKTGRILVLEDAVRSLWQRVCGVSDPDQGKR
jgi:NifU-like protein involved in Fe-S cluster formation